MKALDLFGFFKRTTVPLLRHYDAGDGYHVFEFSTAGTALCWKAGQHGFFTLPGRKVKDTTWRAFSVASVAVEEKIIIATRISPAPSSFKQTLLTLKLGETITMRGPYGWVYFKDATTPVVLIAGGVGITPFRAMLLEAAQVSSRPVHLVFSSKDSYLFGAELAALAAKHPHLTITYTKGSDDTRSAITAAINKYGADAYYCISGAPGMISAVSASLTQSGVSEKRILADSFRGY